jgi:hypothetical protein
MIDKLESIDQIYQIFHGEWLSPALLAPKPHQEHIFDIEDYVWRLCINYIALNRITKVIGYPIPRCNFAAMISMGGGKFRWLLYAPQGFHQIGVDEASQEKLAFAMLLLSLFMTLECHKAIVFKSLCRNFQGSLFTREQCVCSSAQALTGMFTDIYYNPPSKRLSFTDQRSAYNQ